jgi:hypothetical protein
VNAVHHDIASALVKFDADFVELLKREDFAEVLVKAWSDTAREAAAEARRHGESASNMRSKLSNDPGTRAKQLAVIRAHEGASQAFQHSSDMHQSRIGLGGVVGGAAAGYGLGRVGATAGMVLGGPLGAVIGGAATIGAGTAIGSGIHMLRASWAHDRAKRLGDQADKLHNDSGF